MSGCAFLSSTPGLAYAAQSSSQARSKITIQTSKQVGFKDKSAGIGSKTSSMSLNPSLFQRKAPDELMLENDANLDYRVARG